MGLIKGMDVVLITKTEDGTDAFNHPVYTEERITVSNVLVGSPAPRDKTDSITPEGRIMGYTLGIPKGDTNIWENQVVEFFGHRWKVIGIPEIGISENIPGPWDKNVRVERYD